VRGAPSGAARLGIAVVAASGFATTVAQAEEQVVVTGTRTPERIQQATVKTDVVTREEAERRGATNVADALATQPGLVVNPGNYGFLGGVSALQIQGFDRDRVLILEDGERVSVTSAARSISRTFRSATSSASRSCRDRRARSTARPRSAAS
jgi:outer membrane cobalamin receptor